MDVVMLLLRLVLVGVFGLAGVTKLADLSGSRTAMRNFGVPERLAAFAGTALPLMELAIAVLLLPVATAWWAALGGLVLLLGFIGGISYNLWKGRTPDCHCFGQVYSKPVSRSTLRRNGVFALIAAILVFQGPNRQGYSVVGWTGDLSTAQGVLLAFEVLLLVAIAAAGWLLVHLLQQNGRLLLRIEALETGSGVRTNTAAIARSEAPGAGLPIGSPAPPFRLAGLYGETVALDALRGERKPVVLLFTDPGCGLSNTLMPEVGRWQQEHGNDLTVTVVSRGKPEVNRAKATEHGLTHVLVQRDREVSQAYKSLATPSAVLIRPDGTIGSQAALGPDAIRRLITGAITRPVPVRPPVQNRTGTASARPVSRLGQPAPAMMLPDLLGTPVRLQELRGKRMLLLFWNPGCGFCARMLDDLKAWEADPPDDALQLLVISTGTPEANRQLGLRAQVLLDQGFTTGRAFGASGTPSAVLIEVDGTIASEVVVGAPGVLALTRNTVARGAVQPESEITG